MGAMVFRVIDFETTGTAPPGEVIEAGTTDVVSEGSGWTVKRRWSCLYDVSEITPETRAVHHICPGEVDGLPKFDAAALVAQARADGVVALAAHHADFEAKWLGPALDGMPLLCTYKAALRIWPDAPDHKNQVLRYWLEHKGLSTPDPLLSQPAHRAGPDAYVTAFLLKAILTTGASLPTLAAWTAEPQVLPRIPIGKQRGAKWAEVEEGFLRWMLQQNSMEEHLKWNARRELERRAAAR
jgi:exodeoxyribonuclease X